MDTPSPGEATPTASTTNSPSVSEMQLLEQERTPSDSKSRAMTDLEKKEMNRLAQREFRKRKAQKFKELQAKVSELTNSNVCVNCLSNQTKMFEAIDRANRLEGVVAELLKQNNLLKSMVPEFGFTLPVVSMPFVDTLPTFQLQNTVPGSLDPSAAASLFNNVYAGGGSGRSSPAIAANADALNFEMMLDFPPYPNNIE
ncbi:hypothetical protein BJ741DRAFT_79500 [Chytriomyces cf. hyalinus JEL632]|nr:hypothetical protein BJ741DRAFT_79500 [Chytriomyces cf. hyalinus JEL632]